MFKFLRKYNAIILAVGGTLLLIVFLVPQAIQGLSQQAGAGSAVHATFDGGEVSALEWQQVQRELELLGRSGAAQNPIPGVGPITDPERWFLLVKEAEAGGFIGGPITAGATEQSLSDFRSIGFSDSFVLDTFSKLSGVRRMMVHYQAAGQLSDVRMKHYANDEMFKASGTMVVIESDASGSDYEPTEAELQAQLDEYRDVDPNAVDESNPFMITSADEFKGFGYKLPNRVKVEWLHIDMDSVRESIRDTEAMNDIALIKHWKNNENIRGVPVYIEDTLDFPEALKDDLLDQLAEDQLDSIAQYAYRQLAGAQRSLKRKAGYFQLPDDWADQRLGLPELADRIAEEFDVATPAYQSTGADWQTEEDLRALEGIGGASTVKYGPSPTRLGRLATELKEFGGDELYQIQAGVAGPPLRSSFNGEDGDVFIFRFIETDAARAPNDVDEVREQLVEDLRRKKAYEALEARAAALEKQAEEEGLLAVALEHDTVIQRRTQMFVSDASQIAFALAAGGQGLSSRLPVLGQSEETVRAIVNYARSLGVETHIADLDPEQRIIAVPAPDKLAVVIVDLFDVAPVTDTVFANLARTQQLQTLIRLEEADILNDDGVFEAFTLESLKARNNFEPSRRNDEEEDPALAMVEDDAA